MTHEEIHIGQRVYDRNQHRTGVLLAVHRPSNLNLDPTEAMVKTEGNAVSWISFENLEEQQ